MAASPLVSIVIPCFNAARWLPAALGSALAQTHRPLEIIAVDDGSTDDTPSILADHAARHPEILHVRTQPNRGQCVAANRGLADARGDYVKFFDADDLLSPDAVAIQVAALLAAPPGRLAYGAWSRFQSDPSEARFVSRPGWHDSDRPVDWICETWADAEPMYQCALWLIPRALLGKAGYWNGELSLINDFEFFTRLVLASDGIVHTPGARLYYRSGLPGSLSAQKSRRALESGCLSTRLAVQHLLRAEDSPRSRAAAAGVLQSFAWSFYPLHPDLYRPLLAEAARLGGSPLRPGGGRAFRFLCRLLGPLTALRLRHLLRARAKGDQPPPPSSPRPA
jgi:glycosyltransferase involved in cell wall biosynthesis